MSGPEKNGGFDKISRNEPLTSRQRIDQRDAKPAAWGDAPVRPRTQISQRSRANENLTPPTNLNELKTYLDMGLDILKL